MAKQIKLNISKGILIKADLPQDNPLSMIASTALESIHGSAEAGGATAFTIHGRYANPVTASIHGAIAPENIHGAAPADVKLFTIHGAVVMPIPEGQKISSLEIQRGEDGDLTIIIHE